MYILSFVCTWFFWHCTSEIWQCFDSCVSKLISKRCRGSWTSRTSRSSRQAPVGLWRFQYEVVKYVVISYKRPTHTTKKHMPSFCHRHTIQEHFLLGSSKTHHCLAVRGFFPWQNHGVVLRIVRSAHEDHIQVSSLRSARQVVDGQILEVGLYQSCLEVGFYHRFFPRTELMATLLEEFGIQWWWKRLYWNSMHSIFPSWILRCPTQSQQTRVL